MAASKQPLTPPAIADHPVDVGLRTEAAILYYLLAAGYDMLVPVGFNQRYDLVVDLDGHFVRAQCKTGRYRNGAILFSTQSVVSSKTRNVPRDYRGAADVFLVHCPKFESVYCVPVDSAARGYMSLRVDPTENGQRQGVNWAVDYQLPG